MSNKMLENIAFLLDLFVFLTLSIAWFFLPVFGFSTGEANEVKPLEAPEKASKVTTDFIDNQLLKAKNYYINEDVPFVCGNEYVINGILFKENIKVDKFRQFELYKVKMDDYSDTSGVSIDDDTYLQMTLEPAPNGVIINSNVYLTHQQWNTLILVSEESVRCAVCNVYCDVTEHVATSVHVANMDIYRPLNKYDLTITRMIKNNYHCGVCNVLYEKTLKNDHLSSKTHEDKLLFAINKVSDIMYDFNIYNNNNVEKKDSYHFSAKAINNNNIANNESSDSEDETDDEEECDYRDPYNDPWNRFNGLSDDENDFEEPQQNLEFSYASVAKKPKTDDLPEVLEVDLGKKKVTVKFNSWNMLIRPMPNRFYCMACKQIGHARHTAEHCKSQGHMDRLNACTVVEEYDKYFVRQVDDKCYHCGHCNNLQIVDAMEDHIVSHHPNPTSVQALLDTPAKKISTPIKTVPKHDNEGNYQANNDNIGPRNSQEATNNDHIVDIPQEAIKGNEFINPNVFSEADLNEALRCANSNFEDIVICTYGSKLRISKLAFNIVCQGDNEFYCGLCEVNISREHLKVHVNDTRHLSRLRQTPFIQAFNVHLFREIRDALHCALCNELVQLIPEFIIKHNYLEKHIVSLNRALSIKDDSVEINAEEVNNGATATAVSKLTIAEISKVTTTNGTNKVPATIKNDVVNTNNDDTAIVKNNVALNDIAAGNTSNKTYGNIVPATNGVTKTPTQENLKDRMAKLEAAIIAAQKEEEFIVVRNGVKEEIPDELEDSFIEDFDLEEYVYVKIGNSYIKITNTSYNTLVDVGDGGKYCFVCSSLVGELSRHVESRGHMENMEKIKFVDKYNEDLLRQFYLMYHCSICNVVITRKQLNHHLTWPTHALQTENTKINSKKRKSEIKSGTKQITVSTQKENIYLNEKETDNKLYLNIAIDKERMEVSKLNKIVIFNDNVLKVSFDCWHSVSEMVNGFRCKVCQYEFDGEEFGVHVNSERHKGNLDKIEKQYSPALIRKINDTTLNCVMCNTEVSNKRHIVTEHIRGKRHIKHYETMLKESSVANSYADCDQDVLML